jgi:hypothetical protein
MDLFGAKVEPVKGSSVKPGFYGWRKSLETTSFV